MIPHPWSLTTKPGPEPVVIPEPLPEPCSLVELERRHIRYALAYADGNKSRVARLLQIDRRTLYRKLAQYAQEG
jgi:DNA-binding NtrC family response regulator